MNRTGRTSLFRDLAIALAWWLAIGVLFMLIFLPPLGGSSPFVAGRFVGHVNMSFSGESLSRFDRPENYYMFRFAGDSLPKWRPLTPRTFQYRNLDLEWFVDGEEGAATLDLDTREYRSGDRSGLFTRTLLESWLLPNKTTDARALRDLDTVYQFIESAATGTLPPTSHHGHGSNDWESRSRDDPHFPLRWRLQHGYGNGTCGVWIPLMLWLGIGLYGGIRLRRKHRAPITRACEAAPNGESPSVAGRESPTAP